MEILHTIIIFDFLTFFKKLINHISLFVSSKTFYNQISEFNW